MRLHAPCARLPGGWVDDVLVDIGDDGRIVSVVPDTPPPADAERLAGPLVPGMPNLHSHAFQRAFAGFSERRGSGGEDSFWTWRQVMYDFVSRVTPEQTEAIAAWLYVEMLKSGYTAVGEFHYLHHDVDGGHYADIAEMSERVIAAARDTGIAITHLPVVYANGGFGGQPPGGAQRRFVNDDDSLARLLQTLFGRHRDTPGVRIGIAPHSLRAVTPELLGEALSLLHAHDAGAPVHLHIAEQIREVEDCIAWCGRRPVRWLLDEIGMDARWCLVHATHLDESETRDLASSGAIAGICPTTEANLGDGLFPALAYLQADGRFGIGSDSHVSVSPVEELRLFEYGQRLAHRRRALLCVDDHNAHVGAGLWLAAAAGGAQALGRAAGAIAPGLHADMLVLDPQTPALYAKSGELLLDALVFAGNENPVRDVMVGGQWCVRARRHPREETLLARFREAQASVRV